MASYLRLNLECLALGEGNKIRVRLDESFTLAQACEALTSILREQSSQTELKVTGLFVLVGGGEKRERVKLVSSLLVPETLGALLGEGEDTIYAEVVVATETVASASASSADMDVDAAVAAASGGSKRKSDEKSGEIEGGIGAPKKMCSNVASSSSSSSSSLLSSSSKSLARAVMSEHITVYYQTIARATEHAAPRPLEVTRGTSLLELKRRIAKEEGVKFTPDIDKEGYVKDGDMQEVALRVRIGDNAEEVIEITIAPCLSLKSLKPLVVEALSAAAESGSAVDFCEENMEYFLVGGIRFDPDSSTRLVSVQDVLDAQSKNGNVALAIYGTGYCSLSSLPEWDIKLQGGNEGVLATRLLGEKIGIPNTKINPERAGETIADLKRIIAQRFLQDLLPSTTPPFLHEIITLEFNGQVLHNNDSIGITGLCSNSTITVSSAKMEEIYATRPGRVALKLQLVGVTSRFAASSLNLCPEITVSLHDKISFVKKAISRTTGIAITSMRLSRHVSFLLDTETVQSSGLTDGSFVKVSDAALSSMFSDGVASSGAVSHTLAKPRLVVDLCLRAHTLLTTPKTDRQPLHSWCIGNGTIVYAIIYQSTSIHAAAEDLKNGGGGVESRYSKDYAFRTLPFTPHEEGSSLSPVREHTDAAICGLLSPLRVLCETKSVTKKQREQTLALTRKLFGEHFPPAALALYYFLDGTMAISKTDKAIVSQTLYIIGRKLMPLSIRDINVLENTRTILNFLLTQPALMQPPLELSNEVCRLRLCRFLH